MSAERPAVGVRARRIPQRSLKDEKARSLGITLNVIPWSRLVAQIPAMISSQNVTCSDIDALLKVHGRLIVCTIVRAQGSVPRRTGSRMVVLSGGERRGTVGGGLFESLVTADALKALADNQSGLKSYDFREVGLSPEAFGAVCGGQADVFFQIERIAEQLLIVGGGHCGRALARAAALLGDFAVTMIDVRPEYAGRADLPEGVTVELSPPDFPDLRGRVTPDTYIALVSQGAATDEAALRRVVQSEAAYIGMMGSRKKVRTVLDTLTAEGVPAEALARIHAPIGLPISSDTPAEIAISILAQIISTRAGLIKTRKH